MQKKWFQLLLGVLLIWLFIWQIVPRILHSKPYAEMNDFVREHDIDTGALFYTEIPEAGEANFYFMND